MQARHQVEPLCRVDGQHGRLLRSNHQERDDGSAEVAARRLLLRIPDREQPDDGKRKLAH